MPIPDETREPMAALPLVQEKQTRPAGRYVPLGLSVAAVIAVTIAGFLVSSSPAWTSVDLAGVNAVGGMHTSFADGIAVGISWLFGPPMAVLITLLVATSVFAVSRRLVTTVWFVVLVAVPWLGSEVIKLLVHRVRPDFTALVHPIVATPTTWSFPSGHTAFAASLSLALIVILWKTRWHRLTVVAGVVLGLTVAVSRVYLGVHYPTDVLASLVYSVAAVTIVNSAWAGLVAPRFSRPPGSVEPRRER